MSNQLANMDPFDIDPEMATIIHEMSDEELLDFIKVQQDHDEDGIELYIYVLLLNFTRTGSIEHLEAAILQAEGWIAETASDDPKKSHRSGIHNLLVANKIQADERNEDVTINDDWFESHGIGVVNNENLYYLINKTKAWLIIASSDHPQRLAAMEILSFCYKQLFQASGDLTHLSTSIGITEEMIAITFDDNVQQARHFAKLAELQQTRYMQTRDPEDLNNVVEAIDMAVSLTTYDDYDNRANRLDFLGASLGNRFSVAREKEDLDRGIEAVEKAVALRTSEGHDKTQQLFTLDNLMLKRWAFTKAREDLDHVLENRDMILAVETRIDDRVEWLYQFRDLAELKFDENGAIEDLDRAVGVANLAVKYTTVDDVPSQTLHQDKLARLLKTRFDATSTTEDLNQIIEIRETALITAPDHARRLHWLVELATLLDKRFKRFEDVPDLDRSITLARLAVTEVDHDDHKNYSGLLSNLATTLRVRFAQTGQREDLNRAVEVGERVLDALAPEHPERSSFLTNFAYILNVRYDQTGNQDDLKRIIETFEEVVTLLTPDSPIYASSLSSFATALSKRFEVTESMDDLARALKYGKMATAAILPHSPFRSLCFANLGKLLDLQFVRTQNPEDKDASIEATETALATAADNDSGRIITMSNLASALVGRLFKETGKAYHLNQTVEIIKTAVEVLPPSNADRARIFYKAGFHHLYRNSELGDDQDLEEACVLFKAGLGCENSIPTHRILCADSAARVRADQQNWEDSTFFYEAGLNLLPVVSPRSLKHSDKQYTLGHFAGLAARGAGAALNAKKQASDALTLLELGRGVISGLILEMRTDITELRENHPKLAEQFTSLRDELDAPNEGPISLADIDNLPLAKLEAKRSQETDQKFKEVLAKIRQLPNFEGFLLPPTVDQIKAAASKGPIAVINVSRYRCDAFLITSSEIKVLELPNLHEREVNEHAMVLNAVGVTSSLLEWLWDVVARPVLEALGFKQTPSDDDWPHLWWIPTGALTQLPIHASGYHFRGSTETVIDRVISSYSSSVKALIYGRRNDVRQQPVTDVPDDRKKSPDISLLVGMSKTPGLHVNSDLPYAAEEVEMLDDLCASMGLETVQPARSRKEVLRYMSTCCIFHFAGHGQTDPSDPSRSCLLLDDWKTNPLTVGDLRDSNMANNPPFLGYLSACSTGANKAKGLLDEGIHLISAFQLAGFRHVIGTLWEVSDRHCVDVARVLYETIQDEGMTDKAVHRGLHRAVRALRDGYVEERRAMGAASQSPCNENLSQENPQYWAPYVHFGV
ncbi:uncharacterized protein LY89DRAFT_656612 [Mollisia scopiformis]|uniref:CHAT domain-containing protein n=1 Tax=Mollisia scopiformis TaxID=149040 RepID=A0A132BDD9_MOLSC|nr:uncharacterized protein LY89DRAFT_656612 [Mollisia scopiformis]KUJ09999.1 hypothetical protein LY89DRAFT_656612 [Mollisia scopiformis]